MNHCESYEPLLDAFTEGDLFMEDMVRVQQHLNSCPDCQAYIEDLLAMRAAFPTVEETEVPAGFTAGVMAAVAATPQAAAPAAKSAASAKRKTPWVKVLSGLAACCAIVLLAQGGIGMGGDGAAPETESAPAPEAVFYASDHAVAEEAPAAEPKLAQPETESQAGNTTESPAEVTGAPEEDNSPYRIVVTVSADYVGDALDNRLPLVKYDEVVDGKAVSTREYELTMAEYDELLHQLSEERGELPEEEGFNSTSALVLIIVRQ